MRCGCPSRNPGTTDLPMIDRIASGADLRPGALLAEFAIDWVVVEGTETPLDPILDSQVDLTPTPLITGAKVFENPQSAAMAAVDEDLVWHREGTGFAGAPPRTPLRYGSTTRMDGHHNQGKTTGSLPCLRWTGRQVSRPRGTCRTLLTPPPCSSFWHLASSPGEGRDDDQGSSRHPGCGPDDRRVAHPRPEPPQADEVAAVNAPAVAVCPVEEGSGRTTTIGVASGVNGEGRFTAFAAGVPRARPRSRPEQSGSAAIPIAEVAPLGTGAGLAELPGQDVAAASVLVGA